MDGLHLLLSEVKTSVKGTEFIEIYNPSEFPVLLDNYYLSDTMVYAELPTAPGPGSNPSVANSDFIARFPLDTAVAAKGVVVVGVNAYLLLDAFGVEPDFRIGNSGGGVAMLSAYPSSIGSQSGLTDDGEGIVLFYWDGETDLVTDIDMVTVGSVSTIKDKNALANKTAQLVDGPDPDDLTSEYQVDLSTMTAFNRGTALLESYERVAGEAGAETQVGSGNGSYGHDESTEYTNTTWAIALSATPGTVPTTLSE